MEELPFRFDNDNLRNATGLDSEMEEESEKGDGDDEEDDGGGEKEMMRTMRWVGRMKNSQQRGDPREIMIGESEKNMVGVWRSLLCNIVINARTSQSQINFKRNSKMLFTKYNFIIKFKML